MSATPEAKPQAPSRTTRTANPRSSASWAPSSRAVAHGEVLVAVALEPEVGVADAEVAGPLERDLAEPPVGQRQERRVDLVLGHANDPSGRPIGHLDGGAAARLAHLELGGDAVAQLGHVADQAHDAATVAQRVEGVHHTVEGGGVEGAEALVDEQGVERVPPASWLTVSARPSASARETMKVSPPESVAGSRCLPLHSSRTRRLSPPRCSPAPRSSACSRREPLVGHRAEPLVGGGHDLTQPLGEHVGREPHPQLVVDALALDERGQSGRQGVVARGPAPRPPVPAVRSSVSASSRRDAQRGLLVRRVQLVARRPGLAPAARSVRQVGGLGCQGRTTGSSASTASAAARDARRSSSAGPATLPRPPVRTAAQRLGERAEAGLGRGGLGGRGRPGELLGGALALRPARRGPRRGRRTARRWVSTSAPTEVTPGWSASRASSSAPRRSWRLARSRRAHGRAPRADARAGERGGDRLLLGLELGELGSEPGEPHARPPAAVRQLRRGVAAVARQWRDGVATAAHQRRLEPGRQGGDQLLDGLSLEVGASRSARARTPRRHG